MSHLNSLLSLVVMWALGAALMAALGVNVRRLSRPLRAGLALALGLSGNGLFSLYWGLAGLPYLGLDTLLALGLCAAALRLRRRPWLLDALAPGPPEPRPSARSRAARGLLALAVLGWLALWSTVALLEPLVEWDVLCIWAYKAKVLFYEELRHTRYFHDAARSYSHPDYPLLWPFAIRNGWSLLSGPDLAAPKLLAVATMAGLTLLCFGALAREAERTFGWLFTCALVALPMLQDQAARMVADVPLAYLLTACVVCVRGFVRDRSADELKLAGALAAGVLFVKNEGIALYLIVLLSSALALLLARRPRELGLLGRWLLALPLALTAPWFAFRLGIPKLHEDYAGSLGLLSERWHRLPDIAERAAHYLAAHEDWSGFWWLFAAGLVLGARRLREPGALLLALVVVQTAVLYTAIFMVTPWSLDELMEVTTSRIALHVTPIALLLLHDLWLPERPAPGPAPSRGAPSAAPPRNGSSANLPPERQARGEAERGASTILLG